MRCVRGEVMVADTNTSTDKSKDSEETQTMRIDAETPRDMVAGPNPKDLVGVNKPPIHLVPPVALVYMAKVLETGVEKYGGAANWRWAGPNLTIYLDAAMRHLLAITDGQDLDPDTGLPHAAHAAACMAIVLDSWSQGTLIDDRYPVGTAPRVLAEQTRKPEDREPAVPGEANRPIVDTTPKDGYL